MAWGILDRFVRPKGSLDPILLVAEYIAETDGEALPALVVETLRESFGAERVCIHFADPTLLPAETRDAITAQCPCGMRSAAEGTASPTIQTQFWREALNSRRVVVASTMPAAVQEGLRPLLKRAGVRDGIAIPLVYHGYVYAVANLFYRRTVPSKLATMDAAMQSIRLLGNLLYGTLLHKHHAKSLHQSESLTLSLAQATAARDGYGPGHVARGVALASALGMAAGLNRIEQEAVRKAALFRGIGKLHVPDYILQKPGPLAEAERAIVRQHPIAGESILLAANGNAATQGNEVTTLAARAIGSHHERLDGSGYPAGLSGAEVPALSRLVAIVDVYCALTADRPYRAALPEARANQVLQELAGPALDAGLVALFLDEVVPAIGSSDVARTQEPVATAGASI